MGDKVQLRSLDGRTIDFSFSNGRRVVITAEGSKPSMDPEVAAEIVKRLRGRVEVVTAPAVVTVKAEVKAEVPAPAPVVETVPVAEEVIESDAASPEEEAEVVPETAPKKSPKGSSK